MLETSSFQSVCTSSVAEKIAGIIHSTNYYSRHFLFRENATQYYYIKNEIVSFKEAFRNAWMSLETMQRVCLTQKRLETYRQESESSSKTVRKWRVLSQHVLVTSKCPDSMTSAFKTPSKMTCLCPGILEKQKKIRFYLYLHTFHQKRDLIAATRLPFVNRQLLLNDTFWTEVC